MVPVYLVAVAMEIVAPMKFAYQRSACVPKDISQDLMVALT